MWHSREALLPLGPPAPTAAPTPAPPVTVSRSVTLVGITAAQFDSAAQTAFKTTVANSVGNVCGADGATRACTAADVSLAISRRDVNVAYVITVAASASATAASAVDAYTATSQFSTDLNNAGVAVTGVTVLGTSAANDSDDSTSTIAIVAGVGAGVVSIIFGAYQYCSSADDFAKMEESDAAAGPGAETVAPGHSV